MPEPIALCIEYLDATDEGDRYLRCVAIPGGEPGLALAGDGAVLWERPGPKGCELCVSLDGRLLLWRPAGAEPVEVRRAGRSLNVPVEKPVMLLDQDELRIGRRQVRLHVHGPAPSVHPPAPFRARAAGAAATLAAAVALGGAVAGCDQLGLGGGDKIEVRDHPPKVSAPEDVDDTSSGATDTATSADPTTSAETAPPGSASASSSATATTTGKAPPIEVRTSPPKVAPPTKPPK
ncbi:MAG: hypothetical protein JRI23_01120 [Deltaproteobacteria bacterium]|jgi:hypothetical protein|nr:hypothetical protein [Deltaproteobacteria bacterium]MBW2530055.1 hypothetical protein [Deltaproteobacteria bacterium]